MDILEFVDQGCNSFISDLCLVIAAYNETFLFQKNEQQQQQIHDGGRHQLALQADGRSSPVIVDEKMANEKLTSFVNKLIHTFFELLR